MVEDILAVDTQGEAVFVRGAPTNGRRSALIAAQSMRPRPPPDPPRLPLPYPPPEDPASPPVRGPNPIVLLTRKLRLTFSGPVPRL